MLSLVLCALFGGALAAPQRYPHYGPPPHYNPGYGLVGFRSQPYFNENMFDTGRFWADLSQEMRELDEMLADFTRRFPRVVSTQGIEGNEYKITIPLSGFEEKDIVVKAREGLLMIQATHKFDENSQRNYLDVRTLPNTVNVTGNWLFEKGVLKIVFPLKEGVEVTEASTEPVIQVTENPVQSREELEKHTEDSNQDADVGLKRGDVDRDILTNEISGNTVEATTYAVDLKDEVEFVPVRY